MITQIKKRDGKIVSFEQEKITNAIFGAAKAVAEREGKDADHDLAQRISDTIVGELGIRFGEIVPTVEQVQDLVERQLIKSEYADTAKAYVIYRHEHAKQRNLDETQQEIFNFSRSLIKGYIGGGDWRSKENANSGSITFQGANARLAGELWNSFALNEMYGKQNPEIAEAHENGQFHIHDLDFPTIAYCCGHSLEQLLRKGFGHVKERVQSSPPKHLRSAVNQMVNYIGTMSGEFAGAQAFSSADTFLAPFVKADNLTDKDVKQCMQEMVYGLNVPSRWGWQAPFSNLTFDLAVPDDLAGKKAIIGGKEVDFTFGDCQEEMDRINKAYLEVKRDGDTSGRIFTFPIDTYNLTKDFNWDGEVSDLLFEVTGKYGTPYFQNYIGTNMDPGAIRAMCCRLNLDQRELMNRPGSLWGPGDSTGSVGVVTINMNRIGYEAHGDEKKFFKLLEHRMDLAKESLEIKRDVAEELMEQGFVPYTASYLGQFSNHFQTIGLVGMHESLVNFMDKGIETTEGLEFGEKVLDFMKDRIKGYQEETGNLYNLEASPAEGASHRLAKLDKEIYPNIFTSGEGAPYITNSTQLPVYVEMDLVSALKHQERLQSMYTGGTIFHTYLGENISGSQAKTLVKKIAETTRLPYFSITPVFSTCDKDGYLTGIVEECPTCGDETEIHDRVIGYYRPVNSWNDGMKQNFKDRKRFAI